MEVVEFLKEEATTFVEFLKSQESKSYTRIYHLDDWAYAATDKETTTEGWQQLTMEGLIARLNLPRTLEEALVLGDRELAELLRLFIDTSKKLGFDPEASIYADWELSTYYQESRKQIERLEREPEHGKCCFCGEPCHICSQCCGKCARSLP